MLRTPLPTNQPILQSSIQEQSNWRSERINIELAQAQKRHKIQKTDIGINISKNEKISKGQN